jgi:GNAT superfamily N-acetyltransferase
MQVILELSPGPEKLGRFRTHIEACHPFASLITEADYDKFHYIAVEDGPYLACLLWMHWVAGVDRVLEIHIAARPEYHGRWLSREVLRCLFNAEQVLKPRVILAQSLSPQIERLARRVGFDIIGPFAVSVREADDGSNLLTGHPDATTSHDAGANAEDPTRVRPVERGCTGGGTEEASTARKTNRAQSPTD